MARSVGQKLSEALGQQVVVDNRPGAGGRLGTELAAKSAPDGYTLIMGNAGSHAINSALYKDLPYDIERDFVPVTQVMRAPNVLVVNASLPVNSVKDLIALYKANPGKYSYGSGGNGSSAHLSAELFKSMAGVDVVHVPYKGATPALTDLIAGQVAMFMGNLPPGDRAHQVRARESAGGDDIATLIARSRRFRPSPNRGCPASRPWPGSACSRRPGRRRRSCSDLRTRRRRSSSGRRSVKRSRDWAVSRLAIRRPRSRRSSKATLPSGARS